MTKQARINAVLAAQRRRDRSKAAADKAVKDLRERVREAVDGGVRLVDLAEAMGVSVTRVSQLKRGTSS